MPSVERIAVLYSRLSGYTAACFKALKEHFDVELLVYRWPSAQEAPFDSRHFDFIDVLRIKEEQSADEIAAHVRAFNPQGILMSGWMDGEYLKAARRLRKHGIPVVAGCDTQWKGSPRQRVAQLIARWYLHSAIDALWVAGERQRQFAARLGFKGERCWSGYYSCDWPRFAAAKSESERKPAFLFVGRYVEAKGIDLLVDAYRRYRADTSEPWDLVCAGAGPLEGLLDEEEGIINKGFVQPEALPDLMREAGAFVLPSQDEPWGVVIHEAAASGLPLLCSDACGAAVHLLQDGYNGWKFETGNVSHLKACMAQLSKLCSTALHNMGQRSHQLSKQYTPRQWSITFKRRVERLITLEQVE